MIDRLVVGVVVRVPDPRLRFEAAPKGGPHRIGAVVTLGAMAQDRAVAILKTRDMTETIRWYTAAGFVLRDHLPGRDPTWCELARDDLVVQFLAGDTPWAGTPAMTGCLYVYPASVDAVHDELSGVINLEWGLEDRDWGRRELVLRDPNGYFLTFAEDTTDDPTSE